MFPFQKIPNTRFKAISHKNLQFLIETIKNPLPLYVAPTSSLHESTHKHTHTHNPTQIRQNINAVQIEEVEEDKKPKEKKFGAKKTVDEEETVTEKPKEKSAEPEEKPKKKAAEVKRKSIGEKKPKKDVPEVESIDEPDHIKVDDVNENDLKPASKPSSRRGSKKEKSPEKTIEVYLTTHVEYVDRKFKLDFDQSPLTHENFTHNPLLKCKINTTNQAIHYIVTDSSLFCVENPILGSRRREAKGKGREKTSRSKYFPCSLLVMIFINSPVFTCVHISRRLNLKLMVLLKQNQR